MGPAPDLRLVWRRGTLGLATVLVQIASFELVRSWPSTITLNEPPGAPFILARSFVPDTPGASWINDIQLRMPPVAPPPPPKLMGKLFKRSPLTLMLCSAFSVRSNGASAVTTTLSEVEPI